VPTGAHVLKVRASTAVYALRGGRFGCYAHRRPVTLLAIPKGRQVGLTGLSNYTITGHDVAFVRHIGGIDVSSSFVEAYDLRARHRLESHSAVRANPGPQSIDNVTAVALRRDGAVAWIGTAHSLGGAIPGQPTDVREVHGARSGHDHLLASSVRIEVHSLRLKRRLVLWRDGGVQRQATL
jgi:hypothetical protein